MNASAHFSAKCQGECIKRSYSDRAGDIAIQMTIKGQNRQYVIQQTS